MVCYSDAQRYTTYPQERIGEMTCLTVVLEARGIGDEGRPLKRIEQRAQASSLSHIFALTTWVEHWFLKQGLIKTTD